MTSDVSILTQLILAPNSFKEVASEKGESYSSWSSRIEQYLKRRSSSFWEEKFFIEERNEYSSELHLFIAVIYGHDEYLPWSQDNAGLTHFATNVSELAGLSVITMNYGNIFNKSEGLSLTTLHEIDTYLGWCIHMIIGIHPHPKWKMHGSGGMHLRL